MQGKCSVLCLLMDFSLIKFFIKFIVHWRSVHWLGAVLPWYRYYDYNSITPPLMETEQILSASETHTETQDCETKIKSSIRCWLV